MREAAEHGEKQQESRNMRAKAKIGRFLAKSSRGKYAALAKLIMRTFRVPAMPVRLSYGAWWLAGPGLLDERLLNGGFETAELKFVERYLKPGMVVMDIGAHHGLYSLLAAKCVGGRGCVRSFEPSPRERKYLKRNLVINRYHNVTVESIALGSRAERSQLFVVEGDKDVCNSLRPPSEPVTSQTVPVEIQSLDEYLRNEGIERVDFIKLDVEGGELEVLRGAGRLLQSADKPVILVEAEDIRTAPWGYRAEEIIGHLEGLGFRWYSVSESGGLIPLDTSEHSYNGNYVACAEEPLPAIEAAAH